VDYYFESDTTLGYEHQLEPGDEHSTDEHSTAMETARGWELRYLDDAPLAIDSESATRVGGNELERIGAAPVRCNDGIARIAIAEATPERFAAVREHFSGDLEIGVVKATTLASLLDAVSVSGGPFDSEPDATAAPAAPVWGRSLERVLSAFDDEATRLHELRSQLQQLGDEMAARETRVQELESEIQQMQVERLRDQEAADRLRYELSDRDNRLDRALAKTQELAAVIQGGRLQ
jgi:hypothetical protein